MNAKFLQLVAAWALLSSVAALAKPTVYDLAGRWESSVEFGKTKFRLIVKIDKRPDGQLEAKVDIPEQGARDIPVNAMLFNHPAVRWEIDPFNTAFNGKLNDSLQEIAGAFEEGPGGKPIQLVFKRMDASAQAEPVRVFTFAEGEPRDIRGYWEGSLEQGGTKSRLGLKIGRSPDGSFAAMLDLLDQGAADLPSSKITWSDATAKLEWQALQLVYEGKLSENGSEMSGEWKQRAKPSPVRFRRLAQPATALPPSLSFTPAPGAPGDLRGQWHGALTIQGNKLRIVIKVGQTPDGVLAGTLMSPDQGGGEVPTTSIGYTNPVVRMEWKGIRGTYTGKLNPEGTTLDGNWEQVGSVFDLKLERPTANSKSKTP